jgi:hypothetical protein
MSTQARRTFPDRFSKITIVENNNHHTGLSGSNKPAKHVRFSQPRYRSSHLAFLWIFSACSSVDNASYPITGISTVEMNMAIGIFELLCFFAFFVIFRDALFWRHNHGKM